MKKLFSCLYGSKLYGTSTPTSDRDIKHIVMPDLDQLLLGKKIENVVKKTNTEKNTRNSAEDVDEEFIPLQIFARHFVEGQTYAIELAFAVDGDHAEQTLCGDQEFPNLFIEFVHELRTRFLTSNIKAMMGYVVNQASLYSFKGERLNATRELIEIFEEIDYRFNDESVTLDFIVHESSGFKVFADKFTALALKFPKYFRRDVYDTGGGRMKPCMVILEKTLPYTNSYRQCIKVLYAIRDKYGARADTASDTNVDWKATMHALRIVDEGLQILSEHSLIFPFKPDYVARLLSIKRGELPLEPIKEELALKLDALKELEKLTELPACNAEFLKEFDVWMVDWLHKFYKI